VTPPVAAFDSPHGFGHAARASAVLAAARRRAGIDVEIFSTVPRWFFRESLGVSFGYHEEVVDVGFRQRSALTADLEGTVSALRMLLPFDEARVAGLAASVRDAGCEVVFCDIAPLGVAVAEAAGLPSVVLENFTWRWLYEPFRDQSPELAAYGDALERWSARATLRIQARPVCARVEGREMVEPIARPARSERAAVRRKLGIGDGRPMVVITMGGYGESMPFLPRLRRLAGVAFLITGAERTTVDGNLHLVDNRSPLYMPDVLRAADALVAKLGYGTVCEAWSEGLPFAHVTRPDSREMASLERFAADEIPGFLVTAADFASGAWIDRLPELLALPRREGRSGGADRAADLLLEAAAG